LNSVAEFEVDGVSCRGTVRVTCNMDESIGPVVKALEQISSAEAAQAVTELFPSS